MVFPDLEQLMDTTDADRSYHGYREELDDENVLGKRTAVNKTHTARKLKALYSLELHQSAEEYERKVYTLPKKLDEKVARLHLDKLGVRLTELSAKQAEDIGVPQEGPFKPDHYRY
jgi:hypothetical protein